MSFRNIIIGSTIVLGGVVAFANHVPVPLSSPFGEEIFTRVVFFDQADHEGVPAYHRGSDEVDVNLVDGSTFELRDAAGATEQVVLHDNADDHLDLDAIVASINGQITVGEAFVDNDTLGIRGLRGGAAESLELIDGFGEPLALLGFVGGTVSGEDDVRFTISLPGAHHHGGEGEEHEHGDDHEEGHEGEGHGGGEHTFAHHPYVMLLSTTEGEIAVNDGYVIPVGYDSTLANTLRAMGVGLLPTFTGHLDENEDAEVVLPRGVLHAMFPQGMPEELFATFVVLDEVEPTVWYTSNVFTIEIVD